MSEHKWEFGDWGMQKTSGHITRFCGDYMRPGIGAFVFVDGSTAACDLRNIEYLPDCTGWDWKPIEPPEGYRLMNGDEMVLDGDLYLHNGEWKVSEAAGKALVCNMVNKLKYDPIKAYARKSELKYRPFKNGDEFKPFRERWWRYKDIDGDAQIRPPATYNQYSQDGRSWKQRFSEIEFEDGSPFGMIISEDEK